jgi:hypothetical protein
MVILYLIILSERRYQLSKCYFEFACIRVNLRTRVRNPFKQISNFQINFYCVFVFFFFYVLNIITKAYYKAAENDLLPLCFHKNIINIYDRYLNFRLFSIITWIRCNIYFSTHIWCTSPVEHLVTRVIVNFYEINQCHSITTS